MKEKMLGKLFPYILIFPSLIILMGVVFYPIAASLLRSFQLEEGGWGLVSTTYIFTDKIQRNNILYTSGSDYNRGSGYWDFVFSGYLFKIFQYLGQPDDWTAVFASQVYPGSCGS